MDGLITRACGSFAACVTSLGLSLAFLTGVFQFIAAVVAAISGILSVWLLWQKVKEQRAKGRG